MRAMWSGAVSFGLVSVPVKLYSATTNHDIRFHQVHAVDGGRIKYKRTCSLDGEEVEYADIVKGYETDDGELIMLTEEDLDQLPVATGHEIDVVEFVPADQIDPLLFDKSYYLEPEAKAAKPYALLREALVQTDRMAVVKVALRQRESIALLRVRDKAIVLQTMLWPDEVREPEFDILDADVELRPQELKMAASLIESLGAEFDPTDFHDEYRDAVVEMIERKRTTGDSRPAPVAEKAPDDGGDSMTDLLTALQRSVEAARGGASAGGGKGSAAEEEPGAEEGVDAQVLGEEEGRRRRRRGQDAQADPQARLTAPALRPSPPLPRARPRRAPAPRPGPFQRTALSVNRFDRKCRSLELPRPPSSGHAHRVTGQAPTSVAARPGRARRTARAPAPCPSGRPTGRRSCRGPPPGRSW